MHTSSTSRSSWTARPFAAVPGIWLWIGTRCAAAKARHERRQALASLSLLRERDPRLFAETGVDPLDLPPPRVETISLFPQVVISGFFYEGRR